MLASSSCT